MRQRETKRAFTLIELLVVLSIISILAGLVLAASQAAFESAKRTQASAMIHQLEGALSAYQTDYGGFPAVFTSENVPLGSDNALLYRILAGTADGPGENPRKTAYMTFRLDDLIHPASPAGFHDPWNQPYQFLVDVDYDNTLPNLPRKTAADPSTVTTPLAIWSNGMKQVPPPDPNKKLIANWY